MRLPTRDGCGSSTVCVPAGHRAGVWLQRGLPRSQQQCPPGVTPITAEGEGHGEVFIGVDPHKLSATIEVVDDRETGVGHGPVRHGQSRVRRDAQTRRRVHRERTWAVEGSNGAGRPVGAAAAGRRRARRGRPGGAARRGPGVAAGRNPGPTRRRARRPVRRPQPVRVLDRHRTHRSLLRRDRPAPALPGREPADEPHDPHRRGHPDPPRHPRPGLLPAQARRRQDPRRSDALPQAPDLRRAVPPAPRRRQAAAADVDAGPGGHRGASHQSSAAGSHPHTGTSDQPLPGPAPTTLPAPTTTRKTTRLETLEPAS